MLIRVGPPLTPLPWHSHLPWRSNNVWDCLGTFGHSCLERLVDLSSTHHESLVYWDLLSMRQPGEELEELLAFRGPGIARLRVSSSQVSEHAE